MSATIELNNTPAALADWLMEDIPSHHTLSIEYAYSVTDVLPIGGIEYRVLSLQDGLVEYRGELDASGQAVIDGLIPGPVEVFLGPEDVTVDSMAVEKLREKIGQSLDSLVMLLSSQLEGINNMLSVSPLKEHLPYSIPLNHAEIVLRLPQSSWQYYAAWISENAASLAAQNKEQSFGITPLLLSHLEVFDPAKVLSEIATRHRLTPEMKAKAYLFCSDKLLIQGLLDFLHTIWLCHPAAAYAKAFVMDVVNGLVLQVTLDSETTQGVETAEVEIKENSALEQCRVLYPAIDLLLFELRAVYGELLQLFAQTKMSRKVRGRTGTDMKVEWREPPVQQRCLDHFATHLAPTTNLSGQHVSSMPLYVESGGDCIDSGQVFGATGEVVMSEDDFTLAGPVPITWRRYYRSSNVKGWSFLSDEKLKITQGKVAYQQESSLIVMFDLPPIGKYAVNAAAGISLHRVFFSVFVIKSQGDADRHFSGEHSTIQPVVNGLTGVFADMPELMNEEIPLVQIRNNYHQYWNFIYQDLCLVELSSSWGESIVISRDANGNITSVAKRVPSQHPRVLVTYQWGEEARLLAVDRQGDEWRYDYRAEEEGHPPSMLLASMASTAGKIVEFQWGMMGNHWRCLAKKTPTQCWSFHWDKSTRTSMMQEVEGRDRKTIGMRTSWLFDLCGRVIEKRMGDESSVAYGYSKNGQLVSVTNALGNRWQYRYMPDGGLSGWVDPAGGGYSAAFDSSGNLVEFSNALGESWGCEYDNKHQITSVVNPQGSAYRLNCLDGKPVSISTESGGHHWHRYWQRNSRGSITVDASNGLINQATYDDEGDLVELRDRELSLVRYQYDLYKRLVSIGTDVGSGLSLNYTAVGLIESIDAGDQQVAMLFKAGRLCGWHETGLDGLSIEYDSRDRISMITLGNQHYVRFEYAASAVPVALIVDNAQHYQLTFDAINQLASCSLSYLGEELEAESDPKNVVTEWQYDGVGRQIYRLAENDEIRIQYDGLGRVVERVDKKKAEVLGYHTCGKIESYSCVSSTANTQLEHEYDEHGFRRKTTFSQGYVVEYKYASIGLLESICINGNQVFSIVRNSAGVEEYRNFGAMSIRTLQFHVKSYIDKQYSRWVSAAVEQLATPDNEQLLGSLDLIYRLGAFPLPGRLMSELNALGLCQRDGIEAYHAEKIVIFDPVDNTALILIEGNNLYFNHVGSGIWSDWHGTAVEDVGLSIEFELDRCVGESSLAVGHPLSVMDFVGPNIANAISLTNNS